MLCIFKMLPDNLYPNPLIGSQYATFPQTHKACDWKEAGVERSSQRGRLHLGPAELFTTTRTLLGKSMVPKLKAPLIT